MQTDQTPMDATQGAMDAIDLFDPTRLPERDEDGRLVHPDFARVVFVEDEFNVEPFFNAAGLELKADTYEWPDGDVDNDGSDHTWITPEKPEGEGWRLVCIDSNEDGEGIVWWSRFIGQYAMQQQVKARHTGRVDDDKALADFTEYFVSNYPGPNTRISDPTWHAPRIFRAAKRAIFARGEG